MPKRTDEERAEIARRCREIEKGGGDVLGYIKSLGYISPRATWYNLQKEFLGRDANHLTEGHPTEDKRQKTRQQMLTIISFFIFAPVFCGVGLLNFSFAVK